MGSPTQPDQKKDSIGPLTIVAKNMNDTVIGRVIDHAKKANINLNMKNMNGWVTQKFRKT